MDKVYKYYAFISYKHKDEKWAKWLQRRLETYHLPIALQKQNYPKHLSPIFRDNTDLTPGNLEEKLTENLELSNYLIVICSRNLAKESHYIDYEIQTFIDMGKGDKIIPFIVDGEPNAADPENECFSAFIKSIPGELLAANVQKDGKRIAALKLIAAILKLDADDLIRRDRKRKRLQRIFAGISVACALFLISTVLNLLALNYERSAVNAYMYNDNLTAVDNAVKSLQTPIGRHSTTEASQILRSEMIAADLKKSSSQFHKEYEIKLRHKSVYLMAEAENGPEIGFCDYSKVFVYDENTGKYLETIRKNDGGSERLEEIFQVSFEDNAYINLYTINKSPVKHTETFEEESGSQLLCINDAATGEYEAGIWADSETAEWTYNENEDFIAVYGGDAYYGYITVYAFAQDMFLYLPFPDTVSGILDMYFSPMGKYLFVNFYENDSYLERVLCVYDLESRSVIFEDKVDTAITFDHWTFSREDNRQSVYIFSSHKVEKYSYTDAVPDVAGNLLFDGSYENTVYFDAVLTAKNNETGLYSLRTLLMSEDGARAFTTHANSFKLGDDWFSKTVYSFFDPHTGQSLYALVVDTHDHEIDITPDIRYVIYCTNDCLQVLDLENAGILFEADCSGTDICSVAISRDGNTAAYLDTQSVITILQKENGSFRQTRTIQAVHSESVSADMKEILFVDAKECIVNSDSNIRIYDTETGEMTADYGEAYSRRNTYSQNPYDHFTSAGKFGEGELFINIDETHYDFYTPDGEKISVYDELLYPAAYSHEGGLFSGAIYTNQMQYNNEIVTIRFDGSSSEELYRYESSVEINHLRFDNNATKITETQR